MSVQAMTWVIDHSQHNSSAFVLLLMIANHAHADGTSAYPSLQTLANETRISRRQVVRLIATLEKSGELSVQRSKNRRESNTYSLPRFNLGSDNFSPSDKLSLELNASDVTRVVTPRAQGSATQGATSDIAESPKPMNHEETVIEPSKREHVSSKPDVMAVFDYWKEVHRKPKAQLDPKRRKAIVARLNQYSIADLKLAVDGCKSSRFHQGANDRYQIYDDIELICRDAKHVDQFIALAEGEGNGRTNERPRDNRPTDSRSGPYTIPKPANTLTLNEDD